MENGENHGKIMGKLWENHGNIMGISWDYHGNIMGLSREMLRNVEITGDNWSFDMIFG
jgi:hypothetical protein